MIYFYLIAALGGREGTNASLAEGNGGFAKRRGRFLRSALLKTYVGGSTGYGRWGSNR